MSDPIGATSTGVERKSDVPLRERPDSERESRGEPYGRGDKEKDLAEKDDRHAVVSVGGSDEVEDEVFDPFVPFPHDHGVENEVRILRVRSIVLGCICGALVNASNVYLGLKTGWTFSANLFGAIIGFAVNKFFARAFPENFPIFGGSFGPKENNIVQTAASAAGGMSNVFVSAFPAMYQLGLLNTPEKDFWKIVSLTAVCGYFGLFFATPLRKFFVIYVARELRLVFPTGTATAMTIRSMHAAIGGAEMARKKTKALLITFASACILKTVSQYATGILWDWHFFTWFYIWGHYKNLAINVESWGWFLEFTPAFIGSGMLVGLNAAWSFFAGSVLAWGIIGPALVHNNAAFGVQNSDDPNWQNYMNFNSMNLKHPKTAPSPRYWLLWPGVLTMIVVSFTELACQYRMLGFAAKAVYKGIASQANQVVVKAGKRSPFLERASHVKNENLVEDPASPETQVKWWMWFPGLVVVIILICVVLGEQYKMPVGMALLSVFLGFFFSFLAIQCTGVTDITPLTAASKASQIILGGATKGEHWTVPRAQKLNLIGGAIANASADQSTNLTVDFRVGFLLRTPPNLQWFAQGVGTVVAVFLAPSMFMLFTKAYPCIIDSSITHCPFAAPSVVAWKAVAVAVTDPTFPIPPSSGYFSIAFSILGFLVVIFRHFVLVGSRERFRVYVPNMMAIALAFVLPQTQYGTAMAIGSTISYVWAKRRPVQFDVYCYAIAAGLIAGEGIGGVITAIFQIAKISGDLHGSTVGCPAGLC